MAAPPPSAGEWRFASGERGITPTVAPAPVYTSAQRLCSGAPVQPAPVRLGVPVRSGTPAQLPAAASFQQRDSDSPTKAEFADKAKFFFDAVKDMQKAGSYRPRSKPRGSLFTNGPVEMDDIWEPTDSPRGVS